MGLGAQAGVTHRSPSYRQWCRPQPNPNPSPVRMEDTHRGSLSFLICSLPLPTPPPMPVDWSLQSSAPYHPMPVCMNKGCRNKEPQTGSSNSSSLWSGLPRLQTQGQGQMRQDWLLLRLRVDGQLLSVSLPIVIPCAQLSVPPFFFNFFFFAAGPHI
jgi:hypothetical protein